MINQSQLEHFRERQLVGLMDVCHRLAHSSITNDYNEEISTWTDDEIDLPCGLDQRSGNERQRTQDTVLQHDATIRLTIEDGETFAVKDKVLIVRRFGELLDTSIEYEIVSPAQRGPSGIRYLLKKVSV